MKGIKITMDANTQRAICELEYKLAISKKATEMSTYNQEYYKNLLIKAETTNLYFKRGFIVSLFFLALCVATIFYTLYLSTTIQL